MVLEPVYKARPVDIFRFLAGALIRQSDEVINLTNIVEFNTILLQHVERSILFQSYGAGLPFGASTAIR